MKVYMAGPIQFAHDRGKGWRKRLKEKYDTVDWLDPFDKYDSTEGATDEWTDERIVVEDLEMIDDADAVLVHWEEVATCGTPMEVAYSKNAQSAMAALNWLASNGHVSEQAVLDALDAVDAPAWMKQSVFAVRSNTPVVVQTTIPHDEVSPWLRHHADAVVETFGEAIRYIR